MKHFNELSTTELYEILKLRSRVFVVEQNCVYLDTDGVDMQCYHLCAWKEGVLMAYSRIIPQGISYKEASIGRVVSAPEIRKTGLGKILVKRSVQACLSSFGKVPVKIGAQLYLKEFYSELGFEPCSDTYMEDGIPHIQMIYSP